MNKKPRFISPYHYRLDWCMWIAQFAPAERNPWLYRFMLKLMDNDGSIDSLLERGRGNPFAGRDEGPKYIRVERWKYSFATGSGAEADALPGEVEYGDVWRRERLGIYAPKQDVFDRALLEDTCFFQRGARCHNLILVGLTFNLLHNTDTNKTLHVQYNFICIGSLPHRR